MKRRTFKRLRSTSAAAFHHNVYVVLLKPAATKTTSVRRGNPNWNQKKPCVYVGMTGLSPQKRFRNHKSGIKAASIVKKYGIRLLPELFAHLNPMPYEAALQMEKDLAADLRRDGYAVMGGH